MRKLIALSLLLLVLVVPITQARTTTCAYASYHPGLAFWCAWELYMNDWNPLDWGDSGDADDLG